MFQNSFATFYLFFLRCGFYGEIKEKEEEINVYSLFQWTTIFLNTFAVLKTILENNRFLKLCKMKDFNNDEETSRGSGNH